MIEDSYIKFTLKKISGIKRDDKFLKIISEDLKFLTLWLQSKNIKKIEYNKILSELGKIYLSCSSYHQNSLKKSIDLKIRDIRLFFFENNKISQKLYPHHFTFENKISKNGVIKKLNKIDNLNLLNASFDNITKSLFDEIADYKKNSFHYRDCDLKIFIKWHILVLCRIANYRLYNWEVEKKIEDLINFECSINEFNSEDPAVGVFDCLISDYNITGSLYNNFCNQQPISVSDLDFMCRNLSGKDSFKRTVKYMLNNEFFFQTQSNYTNNQYYKYISKNESDLIIDYSEYFYILWINSEIHYKLSEGRRF